MNRYLFTVRQQFGQEPSLDCFYKMKSSPEATSPEGETWRTIKPNWEKDEIHEDFQSYKGMSLRLRFNSDMFQHVCMIRCDMDLDAEMMESIIQMKNSEGKLAEFLKESSV